MWWQTLLGILAGILLVYAVLLVLLRRYARRHPDTVTARDALRPLPDVLRLVRRLAADRGVPTGVRVRLVLLLVYLASPVDLVPDFVPVIGYADDAVIVALVLRSVVRRARSGGTGRALAGLTRGTGPVQPPRRTPDRSPLTPSRLGVGVGSGSPDYADRWCESSWWRESRASRTA